MTSTDIKQPPVVQYDECLNELGWAMNDFLVKNGAVFDGRVFNNMKQFLKESIEKWLADHPTQQGLDAKHEFRKAVERLAAAASKDAATQTPLGRFALLSCAASLPIATGAEEFFSVMDAQKMLDEAIAAQAKQGGAA